MKPRQSRHPTLMTLSISFNKTHFNHFSSSTSSHSIPAPCRCYLLQVSAESTWQPQCPPSIHPCENNVTSSSVATTITTHNTRDNKITRKSCEYFRVLNSKTLFTDDSFSPSYHHYDSSSISVHHYNGYVCNPV